MKSRNMAVAGYFYPDNCEQVNEWFNRWESNKMPEKEVEPKALIVPHAGYMYSGACANKAYASVSNQIENVVILGPSHRIAFEGASIGIFETIQTPCGEIQSNISLNETIMGKHKWLQFIPQAHQEHSTEVQFPFIKKYFPNTTVTEIIYSTITPQFICQLIEDFANMPKTLIVISTDLSHFYSLDDAKILDDACIKAIECLHVNELERGEACGMIGIVGLILFAQKQGWKSQVLDYCTSFNQTGDKSQVVGYVSAILG